MSYVSKPDGIPASFMKYSSEFSLFHLKLFILSMNYRAYPSVWETSLVIPIFQKGSCVDIADCEPINVKSVLPGTTEKIICKELLSFLILANLISSSQNGFLNNRPYFT